MNLFEIFLKRPSVEQGPRFEPRPMEQEILDRSVNEEAFVKLRDCWDQAEIKPAWDVFVGKGEGLRGVNEGEVEFSRVQNQFVTSHGGPELFKESSFRVAQVLSSLQEERGDRDISAVVGAALGKIEMTWVDNEDRKQGLRTTDSHSTIYSQLRALARLNVGVEYVGNDEQSKMNATILYSGLRLLRAHYGDELYFMALEYYRIILNRQRVAGTAS